MAPLYKIRSGAWRTGLAATGVPHTAASAITLPAKRIGFMIFPGFQTRRPKTEQRYQIAVDTIDKSTAKVVMRLAAAPRRSKTTP